MQTDTMDLIPAAVSCHVKMSEIPVKDRPYERFDAFGESALSDTELLAVLIKSGTREASAVSLAARIMAMDRGGQGLSFLCSLPAEDLIALPGIGKVKAAVIKCALELGRRATRRQVSLGETVIRTPADIAGILLEEMQYLTCEELRILLLDARNTLLRVMKSSKGSVRETMFAPREIFKDAIRYDAASVVLVHNHPSGDPEASRADIETTEELLRIGSDLGIQLLDHVILARGGYTSIKSLILGIRQRSRDPGLPASAQASVSG